MSNRHSLKSRWLLLLALVPFATLPPSVQADPAADETLLRQSGVGVDGPSLLVFLRRFMPRDVDPQEIDLLVQQLGAEDFLAREKATTQLMTLGPKAAPALRLAVQDADRERAARAKTCLSAIDSGPSGQTQMAAIRLLAVRQPAGSMEALLAYAPFAAEEAVVAVVGQALQDLGKNNDKGQALLSAALGDKNPLVRGVAGHALSLVGTKEHRPAVKRLLNDPDPLVRLRVGMGLVETQEKEKDAIPVLIDLLAQLPTHQLGPVEEVLYKLAEGKGPPALAGNPAQARDAWKSWWRERHAALDLDKLLRPQALLGFTVVIMAREGVIQEVDRAGKVRWQIDDLSYPVSAQLVGADRVLVAEYRGMRVSERDFKGNILWQKSVPWPVSAQRLPNGHTFIGSRNLLLEIDAKGNEVWRQQLQLQTVASAEKLPSGRVACLTTNGQLVTLDPTGKEISRISIGIAGVMSGAGVEVTATNILVPISGRNKVVEIDPRGKVVKELSVPSPDSVQKLANGNLLVASQTQNKVSEIDPQGRLVWEYRTVGTPSRAIKR